MRNRLAGAAPLASGFLAARSGIASAAPDTVSGNACMVTGFFPAGG